MGSMAFWANLKAELSENPPTAIMNFNLWTQCGKSRESSFLDIGFVVSNIFSADKLHFYVPFGEKADVQDLSVLINNTNAIGAIFNEKYSIIDLSETKYLWPVRDETKEKNAFVIYKWPSTESESAVHVRENDTCPGLCIDIDPRKIESEVDRLDNAKVAKTDDFYFRFRINLPTPTESDALVREYTPANTFLQSTIATTYIVDFRLNDNRSLPESISNAIFQRTSSFVAIKKLHFLLMTKAFVDVETGTDELTIRELELNTWNDYIENKFGTKDIVAYHCAIKAKEGEEPIKQWEFFAKLKVNNSTVKVALCYIVVLGLISVTFNLLSSWLFSLIQSALCHFPEAIG